MYLFKSKEPNLVHYVTGVTYGRFPIFRSDDACALLIEALATTRENEPFKLIGYVIMPDHFHLLINPLHHDISVIIGRFKGRAAAKILKWLRVTDQKIALKRLQLAHALKSGQTHALWLQDFSAIDIWSRKFIRQKLNYIHNNPVRAGLCDHPAKWRWSSYRAYLQHRPGEVPIEIDQRWLWSEEELCLADGGRTSPPSKQSSKQSEESSGGQVRPLNEQ
jgi:REP element-mobilizing transposase RayT